MKRLITFLLFPFFVTFGVQAQTTSYPDRQIRIISPFATGGIADTFSRVIAQGLSESWGQTVIVENKTGGGGNIGSDFVAKAPMLVVKILCGLKLSVEFHRQSLFNAFVNYLQRG